MRDYCYRVASAVGLICIEVWGYADPAAPGLAVDRGIAFQLTNILRDYKQDFDAGRVYLPHEAFESCRIKPLHVRQWSQPSRCRRFVAEQVEVAASYYGRSAPLDEMINPTCRPTLWAMTTIYRGLLEKIRQRPTRIVMNKRLRLSALHKTAIALRARWMAWAARNGTP